MRHRARRTERGLFESTQYALVWPLLMLATLGIIEAGVWLHGHNVALGAVHTAAEVARGTDADTGPAQAAASRIADQGGLRDVGVSINRGTTTVTVTLTARIPMPLDLGLGAITETATAPVERVTQP